MFLNNPFSTISMFPKRLEDGSYGERVWAIGASEEDYHAWQQEMAAVLDECSLNELYTSAINISYILEWISKVKSALSKSDFSNILSFGWKETECAFVHNDINELVSLFQEADKNILMDAEDRAFYDTLPSEFTVYRGFSQGALMELSWTTDYNQAKWFAKRYKSANSSSKLLQKRWSRGTADRNSVGRVAKLCISKELVLAAFKDENEIVVDATKIQKSNIKLLK